MNATGFALFETPLGTCGIAWGDCGITRVQLPASTAADTRAQLLRKSPLARETTPPPAVSAAIDAINALLRGDPADLAGLALDESGLAPIDRDVYRIARSIPAGRTLTYGQVAARVGGDAIAREVGQSLGRNPFPLIVPCHRIIAAAGRLGGFSAPGGAATKMRLLAIEGAEISNQLALFDTSG